MTILRGLTCLLTVLLAGCSASGGGPAAVPDRLPGPGALPAEIEYVALGDSYSAGPMIPVMRSDPTGCARSTSNYPAYLAEWLEVASYTDVTCSGADTRDLARRQRLPVAAGFVPPQLDALTRETDLVTLGIGGNDRGVFARLTACAGSRPAAGDRPADDPCRGGLVGGADRLLEDAGRVEVPVRRALARISRRAPDAAVYVVGYPQVLPERGTCPAAGLRADDVARARAVQQRLNRSLRRAAEALGATFVDVAGASRDHHLCAGDQAWVNGPRMLWGTAAPYHPFLVGMQGVADAVHRAVTGEPGPEVGPFTSAEPDPGAVVRNDVPG